MAVGDVAFSFITSGSTATSAAGAHLLLGSYNGLSTLNNSEVVHMQITPSGGDFRVGLVGSITNDGGLRISTAGSTFDMPPMRAGEASQIGFAREGSNNPVALWALWKRVGLNQV